MSPWLAEIFAMQSSHMPIEIWMEPFAGGAGAGLTLLERDQVDEVWLVDANPALAAFWRSVVTDGGSFAERVSTTTPTLALWEECRELIQHHDHVDEFELGFAAFVVNRCSRSGIVAPNAGVMGGTAQRGDWTLASRFNAPALAERILRIHEMRSRIRVFHADGISFVEDLAGSGVEDEVVLFVDPPYIREGNRLYANGMDESGHRRLSAALNACPARWVLTYDDESIVADDLYPERRVLSYDIRNNANRARVAQEFAVFSDNLIVPEGLAPLPYGSAEFVRELPRTA